MHFGNLNVIRSILWQILNVPVWGKLKNYVKSWVYNLGFSVGKPASHGLSVCIVRLGI